MEAIEDFHRRGIVYIELRFSPHLLATIGNDPLNEDDPEEKITPEDVLEEVLKANKIAAEKYPSIMVRFLLCGIVAFPQWSQETAELCVKYGVAHVKLFNSQIFISPKRVASSPTKLLRRMIECEQP